MISLAFEQTIQDGTQFNRTALRTLSKHPDMGVSAPLVYIYTLSPSEPAIPYPRAPGRTIYIGETQRDTGSWQRFPAHFSGSLSSGLSTLINHTLSVYYHSGRAMKLRIFMVADGVTTKDAERVLLRAHLHAFGAYPLGQGGTGKSNTPSEVARLFSEQENIHRSCVELLGGAL